MRAAIRGEFNHTYENMFALQTTMFKRKGSKNL